MAKSIFSRPQELLQELLRDARKKAGLTQMEMAAKLDKPQSYVSKYESGERRLDLLELREICLAAQVSVSLFAKRFEAKLRRQSRADSRSDRQQQA